MIPLSRNTIPPTWKIVPTSWICGKEIEVFTLAADNSLCNTFPCMFSCRHYTPVYIKESTQNHRTSCLQSNMMQMLRLTLFTFLACPTTNPCNLNSWSLWAQPGLMFLDAHIIQRRYQKILTFLSLGPSWLINIFILSEFHSQVRLVKYSKNAMVLCRRWKSFIILQVRIGWAETSRTPTVQGYS